MQTRLSNRSRAAGLTEGFSLIEILTAVSIMMVIIFALYAMFNQTQKALRGNLTQVDVLESGRAAAEMLGRDIEQAAACSLAQTVNLYAGMTPAPGLKQTDLDEKTLLRTNLLQDLFFLSRQGNSWVGTGYRVLSATNGVGILYRFTVSTNYYRLTYTNLMGAFVHAAPISTNFQRVADGIIHLRLTAYDGDGRQMGFNSTNMYPAYRILRLSRTGGKLSFSTATNALAANVILRQDPLDRDPTARQTQLYFVSNALPSYVDLELGVLEPATFKQYQAFEDTPAGEVFLRKQAAKVHLFRQRIPIRTALQ